MQYMNPVLVEKRTVFSTYITFAPTKEEAIKKVTSYSWEIWAETEVLHVERLGDFKSRPSTIPPAKEEIFTKKARKRRSSESKTRTKAKIAKDKAARAKASRARKAKKKA